MTPTQRILGILIVIVLLGAGIYWQNTRTPPGGGGDAPTLSVEGEGDYTVEQVGIEPPVLTPIAITADLPEDAKVILRQKIETQYEILAKEPTRVDVWLQLGVNRKIGGDFEGAIAAWEYAAAAAPDPQTTATARGDLGDLYMYFIKDYAKAQENLEAALAANPAIIEYYRNLFYLYRDIYKDNAKAAAILEQGLEANPANPDLLQLQQL